MGKHNAAVLAWLIATDDSSPELQRRYLALLGRMIRQKREEEE